MMSCSLVVNAQHAIVQRLLKAIRNKAAERPVAHESLPDTDDWWKIAARERIDPCALIISILTRVFPKK
jgi:hypothetical protein